MTHVRAPAQRRRRDAAGVKLDVQLAQGGGKGGDLLLAVQGPEDAQPALCTHAPRSKGLIPLMAACQVPKDSQTESLCSHRSQGHAEITG